MILRKKSSISLLNEIFVVTLRYNNIIKNMTMSEVELILLEEGNQFSIPFNLIQKIPQSMNATIINS